MLVEKLLLQKEFGFKQLELDRLVGYDNENYLISTEGNKYVFKTYPFTRETLNLVKSEIDTLLFLQPILGAKVPAPVPLLDGAYVKILDIDGEEKICRMLSFLEGKFLGDIDHSKSLLESLGTFLGQLDRALESYDSYVYRARKWEWDLQYLSLNNKYIEDIQGTKNQNLVRYFFQQFEEIVLPVLPDLRMSVIHNDANEWNILVENDRVSGIIDFGDLAYSPLINELAFAILYACYDKEDPLTWASIILSSYHQVNPIREIEISILYYLIAGGLCISICNASHSRKKNPENEYALVSEKPAWEMLHRWLAIGPVQAEKSFRTALGLEIPPQKSPGELVKERHKYISPILSLSYSDPVHFKKSAFQYMYDAHGNTFLDAYNNIPHVGHSHPRVVQAGQRQMAMLNTNTRYLYDSLNTYAEQLLSKFPDSLNKVYFVNSGSAASDLALRMARAFTGHPNIMVLEHGYHGHTQAGIDISAYKFGGRGGAGHRKHIMIADIPDTYRGKYRLKNEGNNSTAGKMYASDVLKQIRSSGSGIAAFISEPVVGCGGHVPLAEGYLKEVYPEIRKQGGVCISDEVQVGFGRLGDYFWGYEAQEVVPDIVIVGKPMGNGHPIGAVITTNDIAESFNGGVEFFSSFGGNPVSCAIGLSVLEVLEEEELQENARAVGGYYKSLFKELQQEYSCIGDVRGSGLFLGVELVKDNMVPDTELAGLIKNELRNRNILIGTDGPFDNVIKTKPPMCFNRKNAEQVVEQVSDILKSKKD